MERVHGLHHITAISGDAQENLDFYNDVLGMRLVKKSVNQDDPGTYHLFYADGAGSPGSDITFFPWRAMPRAADGVGLSSESQLAVPVGSLERWQERLAAHGARVGERRERFGEAALSLRDPHGMALALVEAEERAEFAPWDDGPVAEGMQVRGLHAARMRVRELVPSEAFLVGVLGFEKLGEEDGWHRYGLRGPDGALGGSGRWLELQEERGARRGQWGVGGVHHLAWRARDEAHQLALREQVAAALRRPSEVIDRFWFKSVYFMEPGGVLFEIATDGPGFTVDEDLSDLGGSLILPPWLEPQRAQIEAALPKLERSALRR